MGASASTPEASPSPVGEAPREAESGAPSYWPSLTVRTSSSPPEPSTPVAPPTTPMDGPPRRSWGWGEVFGALVEQRVIEAIPTHKVDSMQGMWQRALRAKTVAIERLQDELDAACARVHELEMERDARDAADAFADTRLVEREAESAHAAAHATSTRVFRELRADVAHREKRLCALTDALRLASARAAEHERAVAEARAETRARGATFREAESFLRNRLTEITRELERTRCVCESLRDDARDGEAVMADVIERFRDTVAATTRNRKVETAVATRLRSAMASSVARARRDAAVVTDARDALRHETHEMQHETHEKHIAFVPEYSLGDASSFGRNASWRVANDSNDLARRDSKGFPAASLATPRAVLSLAQLTVSEPEDGSGLSCPSSPPSPPSPEMAERARRAKADAAVHAQ